MFMYIPELPFILNSAVTPGEGGSGFKTTSEMDSFVVPPHTVHSSPSTPLTIAAQHSNAAICLPDIVTERARPVRGCSIGGDPSSLRMVWLVGSGEEGDTREAEKLGL
jgi:hypothetical protein